MTAPDPVQGAGLGAPSAPERWAVWLAMAALAALAWLYLWHVAAGMNGETGAMADMAMAHAPPSGIGELALAFAMWAVMMVGMMLPGAAPMIALFAALDRRRRARGAAVSAIGAFVAGYLAVWALFSLAATALQWALDRALLLSMTMASTSAGLSGGVLVAAGLYQLSPVKRACLSHCRSPVAFLVVHWREGRLGALRMGARHGLFCLGCCALLMLLLFVGGVMNLLWAALLALWVMAEKMVPRGDRLAQGIGIVLIAAGIWVIAHGAPA